MKEAILPYFKNGSMDPTLSFTQWKERFIPPATSRRYEEPVPFDGEWGSIVDLTDFPRIVADTDVKRVILSHFDEWELIEKLIGDPDNYYDLQHKVFDEIGGVFTDDGWMQVDQFLDDYQREVYDFITDQLPERLRDEAFQFHQWIQTEARVLIVKDVSRIRDGQRDGETRDHERSGPGLRSSVTGGGGDSLIERLYEGVRSFREHEDSLTGF